ncbi:MAG: molybdopterin molybdotransferase MoeA [Planctomycetota bacterium]
MELTQLEVVADAIEQLGSRLTKLDLEQVAVQQAAGRILAKPLLADRDSPALDVSAMDGYAIRLEDAETVPLPVSTTTTAGSPPTQMTPGQAVRIFTGAPVPSGAECVVKREDTVEANEQIEITLPADTLQVGQNIRRKGENTRAGESILNAGTLIGPAEVAAIASFAPASIAAHRTARVSVLNTGDELVQAGEPVQDWQIRDSNGATLRAWLDGLPYTEVAQQARIGDSLDSTVADLQNAIAGSDAVLLTGGVSMGDTDYVPDAIRKLGGEIVFHRLPIRPGRPVLGAVVDGTLVLGLPGNPVSVAVTSRVIALPLLQRLCGLSPPAAKPKREITNPDDKTLHLAWYRLVDTMPDGSLRLSSTRGSGDLVSLARSSGFVEVSPEAKGQGPYPYTSW